MKYLVLLALIVGFSLTLTSCLNDDQENYNCYTTSTVAIDSVSIGDDTISVGSTLPIYTYSKFKRQCESFYGYDYQREANERNIVAYKLHNTCVSCGTEEETRENIINFRPEYAATYTFNFWTLASDGSDSLVVREIVVE